MNPHPLLLAYLESVFARPGMYMRDFDLAELQLQLHGYDAALDDGGLLGEHDRFNVAFNEYLLSRLHLGCAQGWARALMRECGQSEDALIQFQTLLKDAIREKRCLLNPNRSENTSPMSDFPVLETPRLVLREIVASDAPALHAIQGDPELMRWFGSDPLADEAAASALIETFAGWRKGVVTGTRWALQPKGESELIGTCGLFGWHRAWKKCLVGYELSSSWQGRGYMREALQAILGWGFDNMALNRIEAMIHPMNQPSLNLAASLGFVQEGLLREAGFWGGRHHDMLQLSLLRREYLGAACSS